VSTSCTAPCWAEVALHQPEIAPNVGNIIRLAANTGVALSLIGPLGFTWDDRRLRRAGLDYHEYARVERFADWTQFRLARPGRRVWALSTHGQAAPHAASLAEGDIWLFGSESQGLPPALRAELPLLRLPMQPGSRSLNLANAVAVTVYEGWRQLGFVGAAP